MKRTILTLLTLAATTLVWNSQAQLRLPQIIGDDMVLQQSSDAVLWGWSDTPGRIEVRPSWSRETLRTATDAAGAWRIAIPTPEASYEAREITIRDASGAVRTLRNVLIGEVWLCSGQSNMEMPMDGFGNQPIEGANEVIARSGRYKGVRVAMIPQQKALTPQHEAAGGWRLSCPAEASRFSATAYFFATTLNDILDCPVGIICPSWGGTCIEGWLPEDILRTYPDIDLREASAPGLGDWQRPMVMYNGMIAPLQNYTIKGFLWYQGCSNVGRHQTYAERMADLVACWRQKWGLGELPFYYVEIAPFDYGAGNRAPYLREAQCRAQTLIPSSGMVSTSDLVLDSERYCIHPRMKRQVGERLAYMALNRTYGASSVACEGPKFRSMEIDGARAVLSFDQAGNGFTPEGEVTGFEAAGDDRVFHPARARVLPETGRIEVTCNGVERIAAVRYCFNNWSPGRLWNLRGLPLVPFRTDNWE